LIGANSAGKSTPIKLLSVNLWAYYLSCQREKKPEHLENTRKSERLGMFIHQGLNSTANLSDDKNVMLGKQLPNLGKIFLDRKRS
jgi:ABC-type sugar transport system ATPase subunit